MNSPLTVIILAAGKGTRMKSSLPKVLQPLAGEPMLAHVQRAARALSPAQTIAVLAPEMDAVAKFCTNSPHLNPLPEGEGTITIAIQAEQKGTGHAVACAVAEMKADGVALVVYGDTPLIRSSALQHLLSEKQKAGAAIALAGIHLPDASGYGRLVMNPEPFVERIVECKDASAEQKKIRWGWGGVMAFDAKFLRDNIGKLTPSPATGEFYLTELIEMAHAQGLKTLNVAMDVEDAMGVNDKVQLAEAEAALQQRMRKEHMLNGVTLIDPATVYFSSDTKLGRDVVIHPNVVFGKGVVVGDNVEIRSFCHIDQAEIGSGSIVGPFARLRPGAKLLEDAHVGNFVEIKNSTLAKGAKVSHLTYVGDASVGEGANIGAGTITCNYDGVNKHKTEIGAGAFIGSNSSLVAPVKIGAGAVVGAGSVITEDVPEGALALERSSQTVKAGRGKK
jgi:bifunctional UDP-N-acetylglucosamine pyrophosphorylase / glucosamine-1-phosphate N-acetyltransferase